MRVLAGSLIILLSTVSARAGDNSGQPTYSLFGTPGLIDMPTGESAPDGELAFTNGYFAGTNRTTLTFQIAPRLSGSFRYSRIEDWGGPGTGALFDRSFDLRFRLLDEGRHAPALSVGLQDILGTGVYSGEYVVATKHVTPRLKVTGGIGWGRFGSVGGFSNPLGVFGSGFRSRPTGFTGTGGIVEFGKWFRGNAAFFGGVEWQATDRLSLKVEYSSDAYMQETGTGRLFARRSPFNFGATYLLRPGVSLGAYYMYGDTVGASLTFSINPRHPKYPSGAADAPFPVRPRPAGPVDLAWASDWRERMRATLADSLTQDGLVLEGFTASGDRAEVRFSNPGQPSSAQAVGRVARALTYAAPDSVEVFVIVPVVNGVAASAVTLRRSDIEALEHAPDGAWQSYVRADIADAGAMAAVGMPGDRSAPRFTWSLAPFVTESLFDPDNPVRADIGVQARAQYRLARGWIVTGHVRQRLFGTLGQSTRVSTSVLPHVRSDAYLYDKATAPTIPELTLAWYARPGKNLYARVTAGYLERMYGGISAELLWKPVASRLALGVEVNYVKQRAFNQQFGFQSFSTATGHVSVYWDMGNGFHAQVDAGRYLAGDWGATLSLDREFRNGWRIGAYATLTDVPFSTFGEGSFDKGIRITIPVAALTGQRTRSKLTRTIQPILRDGGARVFVSDRLYETVREYHEPGLRDQWGRFWR